MSRTTLGPARRLWPAAVLAPLLGVLVPSAATAAPADQGALCDGAPDGCSVTAEKASVASGQPLNITVRGNPGAEVSLRLYLVEFNSAGAITGLAPQGAEQKATTSDRGRADLAFAPGAGDGDAASVGGWAFVGLAADDSLDLTHRLGALVAFGNNSVRLLGDGYAYQKPVDTELDLHLIGNKKAGYWVEYRAEDGTWTPLPGKGPERPTNLRNDPGEVGQIPYTVPAGLTQGKPYTFRLNTTLNYSGGSLLKDAGFTEWIVVPSDQPRQQGRGKNFNPDLPAGTADRPDPVPSYTPEPTESATPSPSPTPSGTGSTPPTTKPPSAKPSSRPSTSRPSPNPSASRSAQATASTSPTPQPSPTLSAPPPATPTPTPSASNTADGAVWGNEATPPPAAPLTATPASFPVATATAVLLVLLAAAPLGWWGWSRHRLAGRELEDLG